MTKTELNALLATPLSASKLKKTPLVELQAMVEAQKPKAERKPRTLAPRVMVEPSGEIKAVRDGSKKHALLAALERGATIEELMAATGWIRATVQSAFRVDVASTGFGCERREDSRYYLLFPAGVKRIPVMTADVSRAAAVAGCR